MDIQEVEVIISKNGQVQILVRGAKGRTCLELTRSLENALGNDIEREFTSEAVEKVGFPIENTLHQNT
jgi:hypothetical protein